MSTSKRHQKHVDPRPHVVDTKSMPGGAPAKTAVGFSFVLLALAVGFVIGFAVYTLMNASTWLTELLWNGVGTRLGIPLFPLIACTLGGIIIGLWTNATHSSVQPLEEVMGQFKSTGSYRTNGIVRPTISFLLPLVFGGSIGFEAGLTGIITSCCCWIRDKLKAAGLRMAAVANVGLAASLSAIFRTPLVGIVAGSESTPNDGDGDVLQEPSGKPSKEPNVDDYNMRRGAKLVLYTAAAFGAFGGIAAFNALFGASGGLPHFGSIVVTGPSLLWTPLCLVVAYVMTLLFHGSSKLFGNISKRMGDGPAATVAKPVIAGVALGAMACALPYVLFPGESQSEELMEVWSTWTALALFGTAVAKSVATPLCINMGWVGGDLFPSIFAGVCAGYGLAALTGADPMLMVTVTTTAYLAGVVRKPLMVLAILLLCFPINGLLWMGLAAVIGAALPVPRTLVKAQEEPRLEQ